MYRNFTSRCLKLLGIFAAIMLIATACGPSAFASEGASPANCTFIVGDGKNGDDASIHEIIRPRGDDYTVGGGEDSWFVWCNPRNYMINEGKYVSLDGNPIGDINEPLEIVTPSGVRLYLSVEIFWTLNQSDEALTEFWTICLKYSCATPEAFDPTAVENNFASPGWNGFLAENFLFSLASAAREGSSVVNDDIWLLESTEQFDLLADNMSGIFNEELRFRMGFQNDIICGSSTSQWQDPENPGEDGNVFNCTPIRVKITDVTLADINDQPPAGQVILNNFRYNNAEILYGDNASQVLGDMDRIETCTQAGSNCTVVIGDTGNVGVVPNEATAPEPTEEAVPEG